MNTYTFIYIESWSHMWLSHVTHVNESRASDIHSQKPYTLSKKPHTNSKQTYIHSTDRVCIGLFYLYTLNRLSVYRSLLSSCVASWSVCRALLKDTKEPCMNSKETNIHSTCIALFWVHVRIVCRALANGHQVLGAHEQRSKCDGCCHERRRADAMPYLYRLFSAKEPYK